jgi:hypothetical protein
MGMPKKSPSLTHNGVVVDITLTSLNGALSYVSGPISPPTSKLSNSMPVSNKEMIHVIKKATTKILLLNLPASETPYIYIYQWIEIFVLT